MAVFLDGIIKQEDLDVVPRRVSFRELVGDEHPHRGDTFVQFLPDGRLPEQPHAKEPEVSQEELHQRRLETIERETYQKAFAAGEEAGLALGEETMEREIARLLPQFESVLHQLDLLPKRVFASAERFLVETAILLTRELLTHELTVNPEGIVHRVRRLLDQAVGRRDIVLHLAPDSATILQNLSGFEKLRIEADPDMAPGSVRMESDFGGIEDNLERQLAEVEAGLRSYLQDRLQTSGCEDLVESARQSAEQSAIENRKASPLVKPSPAREQPASPPAQRRDVPEPPAAAPVGLAAIAGALADELHQNGGWPDEGEEGEPRSVAAAPWDETVVSRGAVWPGMVAESAADAQSEEDASLEETVVSLIPGPSFGGAGQLDDATESGQAEAETVLSSEEGWAAEEEESAEPEPGVEVGISADVDPDAGIQMSSDDEALLVETGTPAGEGSPAEEPVV
ncbi:MAG: FliH/SctL family protein [Magnetococcus sp. MYC-9]